MGRKTARALNEARETAAAWALRTAAADKRMAVLERELAAEREQSFRLQNELQATASSLERHVRENLRLSHLLSDGPAIIEHQTSRLAQARSALETAAAERNEADSNARVQIATLTVQLEAMTARATAAEKLVSETQQNLLAAGAETSRCQRRLASMQISLQEAETQVQALRQAQSKLIEQIKSRDEQIKSRDAALASTEASIAVLDELFLQLEAKAASNAGAAAEVKPALESHDRGRPTGESPAEVASPNCQMLKRDLDSDAWLFGREFFRAA